VNNPSSRQTFVKNIALVYDQFHLDGIDIDWEYPAQRGDPRNYVGVNDTANFLEFLWLLRGTLPRTARISAAVQTTPFTDATGQPMKDVRPFSNVLDWLLIMNYDVWGGVSCHIFFQLSHQCGCSFVQPWAECTPKRRLSKLYTTNG
jgi:chitinase